MTQRCMDEPRSHEQSSPRSGRAVLALLLAIFTVGSAATAQDGAAPPVGPDGGSNCFPSRTRTLAGPVRCIPRPVARGVLSASGVGGRRRRRDGSSWAGSATSPGRTLSGDVADVLRPRAPTSSSKTHGLLHGPPRLLHQRGRNRREHRCRGPRHFFLRLNTVVGGSFWY